MIARRHHSTQQTVYTPHTRKRVAPLRFRFVTVVDRALPARTIDTDVGKTLLERIEDLTRLLAAYRSGAIKQHSR